MTILHFTATKVAFLARTCGSCGHAVITRGVKTTVERPEVRCYVLLDRAKKFWACLKVAGK